MEKLTCSFQIQARKHSRVGCLFFPEGCSLSPHPANSTSKPVGKALLGDLFSGVVSPEPGDELGDLHTQAKAEPHVHMSVPGHCSVIEL